MSFALDIVTITAVSAGAFSFSQAPSDFFVSPIR
jgi:hypothetical protein